MSTLRRRLRTRRPVRRPLAAALVGVTAALSLTACVGYEENICSRGEYPAMAIGDSGSYCEKDGKEPDPGFTRYPEGKVPQHVGDQWDEYWTTRTVDKDGKIIDLPAS
ncbi:SCO0607 family lipoprotein [Streptomyces sp. NPDC090025]|uniref:SCO0607 family lipoprotein n=1 Tax=Streptomyces sp. NPDC090025 TaxID=3365922 RepID=UPI0038374074